MIEVARLVFGTLVALVLLVEDRGVGGWILAEPARLETNVASQLGEVLICVRQQVLRGDQYFRADLKVGPLGVCPVSGASVQRAGVIHVHVKPLLKVYSNLESRNRARGDPGVGICLLLHFFQLDIFSNLLINAWLSNFWLNNTSAV